MLTRPKRIEIIMAILLSQFTFLPDVVEVIAMIRFGLSWMSFRKLAQAQKRSKVGQSTRLFN